MSPVPASRPRPRGAATPIDDFEWPPKADDLSVYELGSEPWQTRQHASRPASAARQRERPQLHLKRAAEPAPETTRKKLAAVLAAFAIVAAAAGCVIYWAMTRPVPVRAVHHPAPAVAATPPPPPITIVATYPVEPAPSNEATPVDAPAGEQTAPGPSEAAPPSAEPNAVDPGADTPDAGPSGH
jgi:hypothetical protein